MRRIKLTNVLLVAFDLQEGVMKMKYRAMCWALLLVSSAVSTQEAEDLYFGRYGRRGRRGDE